MDIKLYLYLGEINMKKLKTITLANSHMLVI